jgi:hypothetical protein
MLGFPVISGFGLSARRKLTNGFSDVIGKRVGSGFESTVWFFIGLGN